MTLFTKEDFKTCLIFFGIDPENLSVFESPNQVTIIVHKQRFRVWLYRKRIRYFMEQHKPVNLQINIVLSILYGDPFFIYKI